jgi:hypothetical protein
LSNSARPDDEDDEVPPAAELGLDEDEEVDGEDDDLLLCDMDGELLEPLVLFDESAA